MAGRASLLAVLVLSLTGARDAPRPPGEFRFRRDFILGTSFDLTVVAPDLERAEACEATVLAEIERLRRILSTWDPATEISRLNASTGIVSASPELLEVLALGERWRERSGGAFSMQPEIGPCVELGSGTARRLTSRKLSVDALAKGYIIDRAIGAVDQEVRGILLDIGGDIGSRGGPWRIGVDAPRPLAEILLRDGRAVATSGSAERGAHIYDPRTGRAAEGVVSATAIAGDAVTADALATTLCVLAPADGLALLAHEGTEGLIVAADGTTHASPGWTAIPVAAPQQNPDWPAKFEVTIDLALAENPPGKKYRRPYVAVWIENAAGKPVRTVTVWGTEAKYLKDLTQWWAFGAKSKDLIKAVTRATRNGGKHTVVWDGLDDMGKALPQGTYTVRVEVHREHGSHIKDMAAKLDCGAEAATAEIVKNVEMDGVRLTYGPVGK